VKVAIVNQKGGVGKTTTAVNMSAYLACLGYKTLLVDADAQANSTISYGITIPDYNDSVPTFYDFLVNDKPLEAVIQRTMIPHLDIVPANENLYAADMDLHDLDYEKDRDHGLLKRKLERDVQPYDFIIFDTPPHLGPLTLNVMRAVDGILVPLKADFLALQGLAILCKNYARIKKTYHNKLCFFGILITMFNAGQKICKDVEANVREHFGDRVYTNKIPQNVTVAESPSFEKPVMLHGPKSQGGIRYREFTLEFLKKVYGALENA
jgi:chromosome partitioning protein